MVGVGVVPSTVWVHTLDEFAFDTQLDQLHARWLVGVKFGGTDLHWGAGHLARRRFRGHRGSRRTFQHVDECDRLVGRLAVTAPEKPGSLQRPPRCDVRLGRSCDARAGRRVAVERQVGE